VSEIYAVNQEKLDGLCGVYSVVNASNILSQHRSSGKSLSDETLRKLFVHLCARLEHKGRLMEAISDGASFHLIGKLVDAASEYLADEEGFYINRCTAFIKKPAGLDILWNKLTDHLSSPCQNAAILGLQGKYDHWTCVKSISEHRVYFNDSDDLNYISKANCTISKPYVGCHHKLSSTEVYLLKFCQGKE
jgi:hypothetical protein